MSEPDPPRRGYGEGLPDHHDPTAGLGGAAPAQSALTLRLVLAAIGVAVCVAGAVVALIAGTPLWFPVVLFVLAAIALADLVVVARRKLRGEPG